MQIWRVSWGAVALSACLSVGCTNHGDLWDLFRKGHGHGHGHGHHPKPCKPECDPVTHFERADRTCIRKVEQISTSDRHTCALLAGGLVKCWGYNNWGVLGTGDDENRGDEPGELGDALPYVDLGTGRTALAVFADNDLTCAKLDDGSVKCWGYDGYGTVTGIPSSWDGSMGDALRTAPLPSGNVIEIAAQHGGGLALLADGSVLQWNSGVNHTFFAAGSGVVSFEVSSWYDFKHLCGLLDDGAVRCAAYYPPAYGEVGWAQLPAPPDGVYPPVALGSDRTATALALGNDHSCALLDDQTVKCWGRNHLGQLGYGDTVDRGEDQAAMGDALPIVPLGAPVLAIAAGHYHTCALLDGGAVKCWGVNDQGQLGQGDTANRGSAPGEVAALSAIPLTEPAVAIDAGTHSCALLASGGVVCWGPNAYGQLGLGDTTPRGVAPGQIAALTAIDLGL